MKVVLAYNKFLKMRGLILQQYGVRLRFYFGQPQIDLTKRYEKEKEVKKERLSSGSNYEIAVLSRFTLCVFSEVPKNLFSLQRPHMPRALLLFHPVITVHYAKQKSPLHHNGEYRYIYRDTYVCRDYCSKRCIYRVGIIFFISITRTRSSDKSFRPVEKAIRINI